MLTTQNHAAILSKTAPTSDSTAPNFEDVLIARMPSVYAPEMLELLPLSELIREIEEGDYAQPVAEIRQLVEERKFAEANSNDHSEGNPDDNKSKDDPIKRVKGNLPAYIPTGTFSGHARKEHFQQFSGIILLDFDHLDDAEEFRKELSLNRSVVFAFVSPSGEGVKVGFRSDARITNDAEFKVEYAKLCQYIEGMYAGREVDRSGSDVSRRCFVSHDPDIYTNFDAAPLDLSRFTVRKTTSQRPAKARSKGGTIAEGGRNTSLTSYAGLLWSQGYDEESLTRLLLAKNEQCQPPLDESEVLTIVRSITRYEPGSGGEEISETALHMRQVFARKLAKIVPDGSDTDLIFDCVNPWVIHQTLTGSFWDPKAKMFTVMKRLEQGEELVRCSEVDLPAFSLKAFGSMFNREMLDQCLTGVEPEELEKVIKGCVRDLALEIKFHSQTESIKQCVNMFAEKGYIARDKTGVEVIYSHIPFDEGPINDAIITDYREHFPAFDDVLDMLAHARFASDRKTAHLWLKCSTDWGKSFLGDVFESLGITVKLSVADVENFLTGKPVGISAEEFIRSWILLFDEFKSVKSELKQIQNTVSFSSKHRLRCTAQLYAKIFMSAEGVQSLAADLGIEDQFANRFAKIVNEGSIKSRPMFARDKDAYFRTVKNYAASKLNAKCGELRSLGPIESSRVSNQKLDEFHQKHAIDQHHERLSDSLVAIAKTIVGDIVRDLVERQGVHINQASLGANRKLSKSLRTAPYGLNNDHILLPKPGTFIDRWINENVEVAQQTCIRRKKGEIIRAMSSDRLEAAKNYRDDVTGVPMKSVRLAHIVEQTAYKEAVGVIKLYVSD